MDAQTAGTTTRRRKQRVSEALRERVIHLRRRHSVKEVAEMTGLPIGTVKTIASRSGLFRDNTEHRALFTLPPVVGGEDAGSSRAIEARARFGDTLFLNTPAEDFTFDTLANLNVSVEQYERSRSEVARRFREHPRFMPNTLADCLVELRYWRQLLDLRVAVSAVGFEHFPEVSARERFVFGLLAEMRSRNTQEAKAVLRYLIGRGRSDEAESDAILENLIG